MRKALAAITVLFLASASFVSGDSIWGDSKILQMLSSGQQGEAETKLGEMLRRNPENNACAFLAAVCARSRFDTNGSAPGFLATMKNKPESPEGLASACVLGIDASTDKTTALYYFNALLILSEQNPRSIPIHWLAAVMARTLTRNENSQLSPDVRKRILQCGIREYETVLSLMAPGSGPALIHQTLANLLDDVEAYDASWKHREIAIKMERSPWSLHAGAETLRSLERVPEALPLLQEAIAETPQNAGYHHSLGNALWSLERREEAIAEWDSASRIEPNNQRYLRLCAMGCRGLGDYTAARKYTWTALAKDPDNRDIRIWDARFAALAGEPDAKEKLLKAGSFDFNGNPVNFETNPNLWFEAVETGDLKSFRELLGSADINAPDQKSFHQTALMKAAQSGWEPIVAELIRAGADLNLADDNRDTALHYSAQFGHTRVMKLLLDAGANPDLQDKWKRTPLILCACTCNRDAFRVLMDKNVGIELATPHSGTALQNASGYGQLAMVNELLARGANANHSSQNTGETPLITACKWNHAQVVIPLLSAGADVKARDHSGRTALHYAIAPILNVPLVELLLEKGADPAVADNNGVTPITQARLLGFEGMAEEMEKKAGAPEPFLFPRIASPDSVLSAGEQKASQFVIPILLAQGHRPERDGGDPRGNKQAALKELSQMFGIKNAAALKAEIQALEEFQSRLREAGNLPRGTASGNFQNMLKGAAWKIHASCKKKTQDGSAWTKSHVIYLADLGVSAGFLDSDEGAKLVREASKVLSGRFSSWPEFSRSFVLGAQLHNGWEARRYEHICSRLLAANLSWP
jgi:ankyrin repeat protein